MAETKTTTAFTCVAVEKGVKGTEGFSKEHCDAASAVPTEASFEHEAIAPGAWTEIDATNEKTAEETKASTNAVLAATVGGLKATITAKKVTVTGQLQNETVAGAMTVSGRKIFIHYTEAVLSGALKTVEGCEVEKNEVNTNELESMSLVNTMEAEYKPVGGELFATVKLEKCKNKELNEKGIPVTGTANAISEGATIETTAASTSKLKAAGQTASYTSKVTLRMTNPETHVTENPISFTTVVDP
jgi:FlaG/FlaF family flagellin (archaellin)